MFNKKLNLFLCSLTSASLLISCGFNDTSNTKESSDSSTIQNSETDTTGNKSDTDDNMNTTNGNKTINLTKNLTSKSNDEIDTPSSFSLKESAALGSAYLGLFAATLNRTNETENVMISPTSIIMDFGMLENGAKSDTLSQLEKALNGGINLNEFNPLMLYQYESLKSYKGVNFNLANSIWLNNSLNFTVEDKFLSNAKDYYNADVFSSPFDQTTVDDINNYVNEQTLNMIPKLLDDIDPSEYMHLINCIAFEGKWDEPFLSHNIKENQTFHNADGSTGDVTLMKGFGDYYFNHKDGLGFIKDYAGFECSFFAILPPEDTSCTEYINQLIEDNITIDDLYKELESANVTYTLPEFESEYSVNMNDILKDLGITDVFDSTKADLTGITTLPNNNLFVSGVTHKTYIKVDREGTAAAAVTDITLEGNAIIEEKKNIDIVLDRPFIYGIYDNNSRLPIFIGCYNTVK